MTLRKAYILLRKIESLRRKLNAAIEKGGCQSPVAIKLSQQIDAILDDYYLKILKDKERYRYPESASCLKDYKM